jgi:hypothetical protein
MFCDHKNNFYLISTRPLIGCAKANSRIISALNSASNQTTTKTTIMARRRTKKRTHVGASNGPAGKAVPTSKAANSPKSMVIRIGAGEVGPSVSQLVKDVRLMMEPDTASRLKERRANRLRDYITMAGPLGVSHLMLFSRSESGNTNMRLAITPRGPTLHFHVESYSLCKDIRKALKHPKGGGKEYLSPPLVSILAELQKPLLMFPACDEQFHFSRIRLRIQPKGTQTSRVPCYNDFPISLPSNFTANDSIDLYTTSYALEPGASERE